MKKKSNKEPTWDEIGKSIGTKIEKECKNDKCGFFNIKGHIHENKCGMFYGMGFLGALVYFLSTATSFAAGILGIIKAIFWPGVLVYALLKYFGL